MSFLEFTWIKLVVIQTGSKLFLDYIFCAPNLSPHLLPCTPSRSPFIYKLEEIMFFLQFATEI